MYKKLLSIAAVAIMIGAVLVISDYPAEAGIQLSGGRASCTYKANIRNSNSLIVITKKGKGMTKNIACRKAKRRCQRASKDKLKKLGLPNSASSGCKR